MATMNINWKPGQSIIYAGTPIDEDGNIANNSNAVALVVSDTINPNAAEVITDGTWDEETNYHGITISDDCKRALPGIEFVGSDGEQHPATSLPTPKSDDAGKSAVVNEQGNAYALGAGGGGLSLVSGGGINITWDGSTQGRDSFEMAGLTMYKVADGFLSVDDLDRAEVTDNGEVFTIEKEWFYVVDPDRFISAEGMVTSCRAGTYELPLSPSVVDSVTVPSDGVYFATGEIEGQVLAVTSLVKSAPSKLVQNGEDVTQEVAKTVGGGSFIIHVTDNGGDDYTSDKTFEEIKTAFDNGSVPIVFIVNDEGSSAVAIYFEEFIFQDDESFCAFSSLVGFGGDGGTITCLDSTRILITADNEVIFEEYTKDF